MLTSEHRQQLAKRWRWIARNTDASAQEWPQVAENLLRLADDIEAGRIESSPEDQAQGSRPPRRRA
jgi:hypothetical protein